MPQLVDILGIMTTYPPDLKPAGRVSVALCTAGTTRATKSAGQTSAPDAGQRPASASIRLPYHPESVGAARRFVCGKLREWGLDDLVDDAAVIVSELTSNALRTGCQTRMLVGVRPPTDRVVRMVVGDGSRAMPVMIQAGPDATSGRGLAMVHRLTQGRWGVTPHPFGKTVHADLAAPAATSR